MEIIKRRVGCKWEDLDIRQKKYPMAPTAVFVDDYLGNARRTITSAIKNYQSVPGNLEMVWNFTGDQKMCTDSRSLHRKMKKRCCFIPIYIEDLVSDHTLEKCSVMLQSREVLAYTNIKGKVMSTGYEENPASSKDAKLCFTGQWHLKQTLRQLAHIAAIQKRWTKS